MTYKQNLQNVLDPKKAISGLPNLLPNSAWQGTVDTVLDRKSACRDGRQVKRRVDKVVVE